MQHLQEGSSKQQRLNHFITFLSFSRVARPFFKIEFVLFFLLMACEKAVWPFPFSVHIADTKKTSGISRSVEKVSPVRTVKLFTKDDSIARKYQ